MMNVPPQDDFFMDSHVQQKQHLYVHVVKARDLPVEDVTGRCDPYVEVRLGNLKERARHLTHFEDKLNPVWNRVFAFSIDKIDSAMLEVSVEDKDNFVGWILYDLCVVPKRLPSHSPVAPKWYKLRDRIGENLKGDLMLSVWWGTQDDEAYFEAEIDSDSADDGLININHQSKVYILPRLWYVRVHVIEGQDLIPNDTSRSPESFVKVTLGNQSMKTRISKINSVNPFWNEELMFVAAEPFEDHHLILSVEDRVAPNKDEFLGMCVIPLRYVDPRLDNRTIQSKWLNLHGKKARQAKFDGKIHTSICLEGGYNVAHEPFNFSSDFRPSAEQLWKKSVGILELGILSANGLPPMKTTNDGRATTNAYCVAKYGTKWVRTRTIIDSLNPKWNEQYTWEVLDPCTVITIGVFDNSNVQQRDTRIGKVRIRVSALEANRIYTHSYPLFILHPSGLKEMGEIYLVMRFTCSSILNLIHIYLQPRLPEMHYIHPLTYAQHETLRYHAAHIVSMRLSQGDSPLSIGLVNYMQYEKSILWSMRGAKANFFRIKVFFDGLLAFGRWASQMHNWKKPSTMFFIHITLYLWVMYPEYILSFIFLYIALIVVYNYKWRPRPPLHLDTRLSCADNVTPDELDEEFDTFPTSRIGSEFVGRMRYDRLRSISGRIQEVVGDIATQAERLQSLFIWRDPMASLLFVIFCLVVAIVLYAIPFYAVAIQIVLYVSKPTWLKNSRPSVLMNFFKRLPDRTDQML